MNQKVTGQQDGTDKCINEELKIYELKEQPTICVHQIKLQPINEGIFKDFFIQKAGEMRNNGK